MPISINRNSVFFFKAVESVISMQQYKSLQCWNDLTISQKDIKRLMDNQSKAWFTKHNKNIFSNWSIRFGLSYQRF